MDKSALHKRNMPKLILERIKLFFRVQLMVEWDSLVERMIRLASPWFLKCWLLMKSFLLSNINNNGHHFSKLPQLVLVCTRVLVRVCVCARLCVCVVKQQLLTGKSFFPKARICLSFSSLFSRFDSFLKERPHWVIQGKRPVPSLILFPWVNYLS
jgi:hypothetical protein